MEPNKKIDYEKIRTSLTEKYKFLFKSYFTSDFELLYFNIIDLTLDGDTLEEMFISISVDYNRSVLGDVYSISSMLKKVNDSIINFLYEYPLNNKTFRFDKNSTDFNVSDGIIIKIDYRVEESHNVDLEYLISFRND